MFSDAVAYEVTKILKQNVQQGTGTRANIGCPAAGKTGTTDNFNDAWFDGFTPHLTTRGLGRLSGRPRGDAQRARHLRGGRDLPGEIWNKFMQVAKGDNCGDFPRPEEHDHLVALLRQVLEGRRPIQRGRHAATTTATPPAAATRATIRGSTASPTGAPLRWRETAAPAGGGTGNGPAAARRVTVALGGARRARTVALVYVALASCARGSNVVLATSGGSPRWLLGPVRAAGRRHSPTAALGGPLFYAGLWIALLAYCAVLRAARSGSARARSSPRSWRRTRSSCSRRRCSRRTCSATSRYARLDVVHGLDPYTHSPSDAPGDAVLPVRRLEGLHQRLRAAVHRCDVPAREARRAGRVLDAEGGRRARQPRRRRARLVVRAPARARSRLPALVVGLNPLVLVHVVGGAHNDALTVLLVDGRRRRAARARAEALAGAADGGSRER